MDQPRRLQTPLWQVAMLLIGFWSNRAQACVGDCNGAGMVDIADLIVGVNIALGAAPVTACPSFANATGAVDIAQLIVGVDNALRGCSDVRFVDNGDGTITDKQTGLMWEKKVGMGAGINLGNLHGADNTYPWAGECQLEGLFCQPDDASAMACAQGVQGDQSACATCARNDLGLPNPCVVALAPDGQTTLWSWLVQLNAASFAGYADWRIPTVAELESIIDYKKENPAVDQAFTGAGCGVACTDLSDPACSCVQTTSLGPHFYMGSYWSATTRPVTAKAGPGSGPAWWFVEFGVGVVNVSEGTPSGTYVRAVRGGSSSLPPRIIDNGDGTITDKQTGLMWEKKIGFGTGPDPSNLHAADNTYSWSGKCSVAEGTSGNMDLCQPNAVAAEACAGGMTQASECDATFCGAPTCDLHPCATCRPEEGSCVSDTGPTTIWDWLTQLNAASFAGYADWRIPTEAELRTIVDYATLCPALDTGFGESADGMGVDCLYMPYTQLYWSATTEAYCPGYVWVIEFNEGTTPYTLNKDAGYLKVRAIRGGS